MYPHFLYFDTIDTYPEVYQCVDILPINSLWYCTPSPLLNGFVNLCSVDRPIRAYLLGRYLEADTRPYGDVDDNFPAFGKVPKYRDPAGSFSWATIDTLATKMELFDLLTQPGRTLNTPLTVFNDDLLLLFSSTLSNDQKCYWFFHYDCDVSDCAIGRFTTEDSEELVIQNFDDYAKSGAINPTLHDPWLIPQYFFNGFLSF